MPPVRSGRFAFGWRPDTPDARDHLFRAPMAPAALPAAVRLLPETALAPIPFDQGDLGSCTAQAIAAAVMFDRQLAGLPPLVPSRLAIYYFERLMEGSVNVDAGAEIRDGMKVVAKFGCAPEQLWPYTVRNFAMAPSGAAVSEARRHLVSQYLRVQPTLFGLRAALAAGHPVVLGITLYTSFLSDDVARTGAGHLPVPGDRVEGGHAVLLHGYDDRAGLFYLLNSWGAGWGRNGQFTLPYPYLTTPGLCADCWTVRALFDAVQPGPTPPLPGPDAPPAPPPWPWGRPEGGKETP